MKAKLSYPEASSVWFLRSDDIPGLIPLNVKLTPILTSIFALLGGDPDQAIQLEVDIATVAPESLKDCIHLVFDQEATNNAPKTTVTYSYYRFGSLAPAGLPLGSLGGELIPLCSYRLQEVTGFAGQNLWLTFRRLPDASSTGGTN